MNPRLGHVLLLISVAVVVAACAAPATLDKSGHLARFKPTSTHAKPSPSATMTSEPTVTPTASATPVPTAPPPTETVPPTQTAVPTATSIIAATTIPEVTPQPTAIPDTATPTPTYPPPPEAVQVPILMYHYVSELPADADKYRKDLTVTPDKFMAQLEHIKEEGYQTIILSDIYETLTTGKPLPDQPIVLTFDDGYKDAYTQVFPILQSYGFVGEFFVLTTPAHYEAPDYLTWSDMRAMVEGGMSIQAHGRDHYDLNDRSYEFLVYQTLGAREGIEAHTEQDVRFFCYPSGRYDDDAQAVVASAGYWGAVTTAWGTELRLENRYAWPRVRIKGDWSMEQFAAVLASREDSDADH